MIYPLIKYITNALSFGKKKTTVEVLEDLDKKIKQYESNKQKNQLNERKYVGALMLYSIVVYIFGAIVYYLYLMPVTFSDRFKSLIPFLITPIIIYFTRKFLKWYYVKRVVQIETKLVELKEEKKKILEDVKEKETYKKAKEILEKFSENEVPATPFVSQKTPLKPQQSQQQQQQAPGSQIKPINSNGSNNNVFVSKPFLNNNDLINRSTPRPILPGAQMLTNGNGAGNYQATPIRPTNIQQTPMMIPTVNQSGGISSFTNNERITRTLVPRPFIPQERTALDKLLDFLVGDGPSNRYALICKKCSYHNGMALKEEFEYIAFRCAYCLEYNDSRKKKLDVPKEIKPIYVENTNNNNPPDQEAKNKDKTEEEEKRKEKTTYDDDNNKKTDDSITNQEDTSNSDEKMETSDNFETNNNNTNTIEKTQDDKKNE